MPDKSSPGSVEDHKVHLPFDPQTEVAKKARFFNSVDAFNLSLNPVPDKVFQNEAEQVMESGCTTGYVACDSLLEEDPVVPSTTPFLLARYARINKGETLDTSFNTIGSIWYVISGSGKTEITNQAFNWGQGDVFVLPGGATAKHVAIDKDAVLWVVTNEPQMLFENSRPLEILNTNIDIVHYPAAEIERQIKRITKVAYTPEAAGIAVVFSSEKQLAGRNITPSMTLAMNTLPPGDFQRPHRHNSVAVSLIIQGENCYSMVDGNRKDWAPWATTVTPPVSLHSHHNDGERQARFLIVQDGGLYYHARTMGFSFG